MVAHVEQKHWWIQMPFSWGVEVALVLALLASVGIGVAQVRSRDATIADQAAGISQQAGTLRRAELDDAIIQAYALAQAERTAMERALRGEDSEIYESYAVTAATTRWSAEPTETTRTATLDGTAALLSVSGSASASRCVHRSALRSWQSAYTSRFP